MMSDSKGESDFVVRVSDETLTIMYSSCRQVSGGALS